MSFINKRRVKFLIVPRRGVGCVGGKKEKILSIIEIIDVFVFYGVDVIALSFATAVIVQMLKKTAFKDVQNKLYTFLPFLIGTFLYAVYETLYHLDFLYCFQNFISVTEHGVSIGALSTFLYVLYEQFIREGSSLSTTESVIAALIEGYVPDENLENTAKLIAEAIAADVSGNGTDIAAGILKDNTSDAASEQDIQLLAKLIVETLATISAKA